MIAAAADWDWSDWVSPMLVKELRQGLRDRSFVLTFVAMQFALAFLTIDSIASQEHAEIVKTILNYTICVVFLGMLPLWAAFSVSQEVKRNTLELMLMTKTSSWRLLFGKWTARVFQSFLIGSTILPYVIIEYLKGGEELTLDLEFFIFIAVGNLMLLATTIGLSVVRNTVVRGCCLFGLAICVVIISLGFVSALNTLVMSSYFCIWMFFALTFGMIFFVLDLASADLAPGSAHSPMVRRLVSTLLFLVSILVYYFDSSYWHSYGMSMAYSGTNDLHVGLVFLGICILFVAIAIELSREQCLSWRLVRPYKKFGLLGRITILFFLPGRSSAIFYMLPINISLAFLMSHLNFRTSGVDWTTETHVLAGMTGAILIPILLNVLFLKRLRVPGFIIGLFNVLTIFLLIAESWEFRFSEDDGWFVNFFPCLATVVLDRGGPYETVRSFESCSSIALMLGFLTVSAVPWFRALDKIWLQMDKDT